MASPDEPDFLAPEREMLDGWLDLHRAVLRWKCAGLTDDQLRERSAPPSTMSLLGLLRHMTEVERWWFTYQLGGGGNEPLYWSDEHPDGDFDLVDDADVAADLTAFDAEVAASRAVTAGMGLDDTGSRPDGTPLSVRWVLTHLIEEYARHNGHADLLRERIDGATGDFPTP